MTTTCNKNLIDDDSDEVTNKCACNGNDVNIDDE